eukprot:1079573-Pelagomonas_calceolata.AAC.12
MHTHGQCGTESEHDGVRALASRVGGNVECETWKRLYGDLVHTDLTNWMRVQTSQEDKGMQASLAHLVRLGIQHLNVVLLQLVLVAGVGQDGVQHVFTLLDTGGANENKPAEEQMQRCQCKGGNVEEPMQRR